MKDGWTAFTGLKDFVKRMFESGSFKEGAIVFHPSYGEGIIKKIQGSGPSARVTVDFGYATPVVSLSELTLDRNDAWEGEPVDPQSGGVSPIEVSQVDPQPVGTSQSALNNHKEPPSHIQSLQPQRKQKVLSVKEMSDKEVEARKGVVALRLGQILESQITNLSVGTEELELQLEEALSKTIAEGPTFLLVDAAWGAGKTHALTLLQALARKKVFAKSYTVMDGLSTSLSMPMELMRELMSGLAFPDNTRPTDLSVHLATAKEEERADILEKRGAPHLSHTLRALPMEAFHDAQALDILSDFLSLQLSCTEANTLLRKLNYPARLNNLKAHRVDERATRFAQLLKEWAIFASVMGHKSLLVVVDELDVEYGICMDNQKIHRRRELLLALRTLTRTPLIVAFGAAPGDPSLDEKYDPVRDVMSCLSGKIQHIKVPTPNEKNFQLLFGRLLAVYREAYSCENQHLNEHESQKLFQELLRNYYKDPNAVTRRFIRSAIERMDLSVGQSTGSRLHATSHT